uniref:Uncharacterized protein n=1 Tax=Parascaris equorum TaxID=6256 RepID=A0A914REU2_PAREQ
MSSPDHLAILVRLDHGVHQVIKVRMLLLLQDPFNKRYFMNRRHTWHIDVA